LDTKIKSFIRRNKEVNNSAHLIVEVLKNKYLEEKKSMKYHSSSEN